MQISLRYISAFKASIFHFVISLVVGGVAAFLVFGLWYRWPLYEMLGGRELFWLVVSVDVVCGPLLTFVLWNPAKPRRELILDLVIVILIQVGALVYGMYAVAMARPVYLVFEIDRIRAVSVSELNVSELLQAPDELQTLSWTGPRLISVRDPVDSDELVKSIDLSIAGSEPSLRPSWWQSYEAGRSKVLARSRPLEVLFQAHPEKRQILQEAIEKSGLATSELLWLPFTSARSFEWVVLIDRKSGALRSYAPIDGFLW